MKTTTIREDRQARYSRNARTVLRGLLIAIGASAILSACESTGSIGDPISRRSAWVDFIGGGDIRAACQPGSSPAYRLVYNANREDQVRVYDLAETADGGILRVRVLTGKVRLDNKSLGADFFRSFQPEDTRKELDARNVALIRQALQADGVFARPPEPQTLLSEWHFWVISACLNGRFWFDVRVDPTPPLETLAFPEALRAVDFATAPYPSPPPEKRRERHEIRTTEDFRFQHYELDVYADHVRQGHVYGIQRP